MAQDLYTIAQGTTSGAHGALVTTATGAVVASPGVGGTVGTYTLTVDPGIAGDNSDAAHARVMITLLGAGSQGNVQVAKSIVGGLLVVTVSTFLIGVATDFGFDFIIWRDQAN